MEIRNNSLKKTLIEKISNISKHKFGNLFKYSILKGKHKIEVYCNKHKIKKKYYSGNLLKKLNGNLKHDHICDECKKEQNLNRFISLSNSVHNNRYDYSRVVWANTNTKVEIICPIHGSFWQEPYLHYKRKNKCPECSKSLERYTTSDFVRMSNIKHNNKYDYSKSIYNGRNRQIEIICPIHGSFWQRADSHFLYGCGCFKCKVDNRRLKLEDFIEKSKKIHGDKYDYSEVDYLQNKTKVKIICSSHGFFYQKPNAHMLGAGCPRCKASKGEDAVASILNKYNINFVREYRINKSKYRYDFYLPDQNILIEFNGKQHYSPVNVFGGDREFKLTKARDAQKQILAKDSNISLLIIHYKFYYSNTLEKKIIKELKKEYKYWLVINNKINVFKSILDICRYFKIPKNIQIREALKYIIDNNENVYILFP